MKFPSLSHIALSGLAAVALTGVSCRPAVKVAPAVVQTVVPAPPRAPQKSLPPPAPENPDALPLAYRGKILREHPAHFDKKMIALTFDDGPDPRVTPKVLNSLAEYHAHATFFVVGKEIPGHEKLLKRMVAEGHVVGNHTYTHPANPSAERARTELGRTEALITKATGRAPTCFRPPYGLRNTVMVAQAERHGYGVFLWTIDPGDTRGNGTQSLIRGVLRSPERGDIVILHDGNNHQASAAAVPAILEALSDEGWQFVTLPEMMAAWDEFRKTHPKSAKSSRTTPHRKKRAVRRPHPKAAPKGAA